MKKLIRVGTLCLAFTFLSGSCTSPEVSDNTNNPNNPGQQTTEYYLPYVGSINLVDPVDPSNVINVPPEASMEVKRAFVGLGVQSYDFQQGTFSGLYYDSLFWYESNPSVGTGSYYKINLVKGSQQPSKVRISSATDLCSPHNWFYDPFQKKGYILTNKKDGNGNCNWNTNAYFLHTGMGPTDTPIALGNVYTMIPLRGGLTDPTIKGFAVVFWRGTFNSSDMEIKFSRCNVDMSSCTDLTSYSNLELLGWGWNPKRAEAYFCVRNQSLSVKTISIGLNSFTEFPSTCIVGTVLYDGNHLYSVHGGEMLTVNKYNPDNYSHIARIGFDDSEPLYEAEYFMLTDNYVVILYFNGSKFKLIAFPKSGGAMITISNDLNIDLEGFLAGYLPLGYTFIPFPVAIGNKVYFNDTNNGACIWDGSGTTCSGPSTYWSGITVPEGGRLNGTGNVVFAPSKLFKVSGNTLISHDPLSGNEATITGLPPGMTYSFVGIGDKFLMQGLESSDNTDVFFMDISTGGSQSRLTSTPNKVEKPIFPWPAF